MPLSDVALALGPVVFAGFEIPERIGFGGEQRVAVHDMPGGQRVIDTLGPLTADIAWSGTFAGAQATSRARTLDALRIEAAVLPLSWDVFFYSVVIRSFEASYRNSAWVPYRLRVSVLPDAVDTLADVLGNLLADALGDAAAASGFAAMGGVDLSALPPSLAAPGATVLQTGAYLAASTTLTTSRAAVQAGLGGANASLGAYANGLSGAADVAGLAVAAGQAAGLACSNAYLARLNTNMLNAGS